ncbi:nuclear transport factor 2 family protein [Nitrincola tapanii]|uniref:Nuclear transport factor 2 family protein n=1 Tax=Nitrincola tapanii TaxID=1708751 RepID=A0A5A9W4K0_9GAMM|nr:nuclear transport factor 2 family protein [Nitrincola tapanii]KAA0875696.1 nuclear transport factor 2 family protein [Nitrincola tapanii]
MSPSVKVQAELYAQAFTHLTPENLEHLLSLVTVNVHFRDPFNDVHSAEGMRRILLDMFTQTKSPKFTVTEVVAGAESAWIAWIFNAGLPVIGEIEVEGATRLSFDAQGRVTEHLDYWDSAPLYFRLPLLGWCLRKIHQRLGGH